MHTTLRHDKERPVSAMPFVLDDKLGRRAKHRSHIQKPRFYEFNPPKGCNKISVDRLGVARDAEIAEIAIKAFSRPDEDSKRDGDSKPGRFLGWYVLTVKDVKQVGCRVECSPIPENPYHADIVFPQSEAVQDRHPHRILAKALAAASTFKKWGDWA